MPLARRRIGGALEYGHPDLYKKSPPDRVLQDVAEASMTGTLVQIGLTAHWAAELFEDLFKNVKQIQNRVATAQARVHSLASDLPKAEEATLKLTERQMIEAASREHKSHKKKQTEPQAPPGGYLTKASLPPALAEAYDRCEPPPDFRAIDALLGREPGDCLKSYSNPGFFLDQSRPRPKIDSLMARGGSKVTDSRAQVGGERARPAPGPETGKGPAEEGTQGAKTPRKGARRGLAGRRGRHRETTTGQVGPELARALWVRRRRRGENTGRSKFSITPGAHPSRRRTTRGATGTNLYVAVVTAPRRRRLAGGSGWDYYTWLVLAALATAVGNVVET